MDTGSIKDVKVFVDPENSNQDGLGVVFKVVTKPRIEKIIFDGNDELSDKKLSKTIVSYKGELYDESVAKSDKILLENLYLEKGFWNSSVNYQVIASKNDPSKIILNLMCERMIREKYEKFFFLETLNSKIMNCLMLWRQHLGDFGDFGLKGQNTSLAFLKKI